MKCKFCPWTTEIGAFAQDAYAIDKQIALLKAHARRHHEDEAAKIAAAASLQNTKSRPR